MKDAHRTRLPRALLMQARCESDRIAFLKSRQQRALLTAKPLSSPSRAPASPARPASTASRGSTSFSRPPTAASSTAPPRPETASSTHSAIAPKPSRRFEQVQEEMYRSVWHAPGVAERARRDYVAGALRAKQLCATGRSHTSLPSTFSHRGIVSASVSLPVYRSGGPHCPVKVAQPAPHPKHAAHDSTALVGKARENISDQARSTLDLSLPSRADPDWQRWGAWMTVEKAGHHHAEDDMRAGGGPTARIARSRAEAKAIKADRQRATFTLAEDEDYR